NSRRVSRTHYVPFSAISFFGGFWTPATVRLEPSFTAGIRNPTHRNPTHIRTSRVAHKGNVTFAQNDRSGRLLARDRNAVAVAPVRVVVPQRMVLGTPVVPECH